MVAQTATLRAVEQVEGDISEGAEGKMLHLFFVYNTSITIYSLG